MIIPMDHWIASPSYRPAGTKIYDFTLNLKELDLQPGDLLDITWSDLFSPISPEEPGLMRKGCLFLGIEHEWPKINESDYNIDMQIFYGGAPRSVYTGILREIVVRNRMKNESL
jgi:hypothetical protein